MPGGIDGFIKHGHCGHHVYVVGSNPIPVSLLVGIVTTDGDPLSGVTVAVETNYHTGALIIATTDSSGRFQFTGLGKGRYRAFFCKEGFGGRQEEFQITPSGSNERVVVALTFDI